MKSKKITIGGFIVAGLVLTMMTVFFVSVTAVDADSQSKNETELKADTTFAELEETKELSVDNEVEDTKQTPADIEAEIDEQFDASLYAEKDIRADYFENFYPETTVEELYEVTTVEELYVGDVECEFEDVVLQYSQPISSLGFSCPLNEYVDITGHFGGYTNPLGVVTFNNGVNVSAAPGTDVFGVADGKVTNCGYNVLVGNFIEIDHGDGWVTVYNHLEKSLVSIGEEIERGEKIGAVGSTGAVTGPNLGFAIIKDGAYLDPEALFAK